MEAEAQWLVECPQCGHFCSDEEERDGNDGPMVECSSCNEWTALEDCREVVVDEDGDEFDPDDALHGTVPDEGVEETDMERTFRLELARVEQAQGMLDDAETTGEKERIRDAINRKAWEEIGIFVTGGDEDDARERFFS